MEPTWDEYVDPLVASCMEWEGDMSENEMLAEIPYQTRIQGKWVGPVITAPSEATITAPTLTSRAQVSTTIACSPNINCALEGVTLVMVADTQVSITYSAKGTKKFTAWSRTVTN